MAAVAEAAAKGAAVAEAEAAGGWKMTAVVGARGRWVWLFQARVWGGDGRTCCAWPGLGCDGGGVGVRRVKVQGRRIWSWPQALTVGSRGGGSGVWMIWGLNEQVRGQQQRRTTRQASPASPRPRAPCVWQ